MFRYVLPLALPVSLAFLLSACGHEEAPQLSVRPAMVVQPEPSAQAMESYPGEVRARYEPDLAFRIGGKVSRRLVEEGQRVKADQPLAELDPQDVRLQLEASQPQPGTFRTRSLQDPDGPPVGQSFAVRQRRKPLSIR